MFHCWTEAHTGVWSGKIRCRALVGLGYTPRRTSVLTPGFYHAIFYRLPIDASFLGWLRA